MSNRKAIIVDLVHFNLALKSLLTQSDITKDELAFALYKNTTGSIATTIGNVNNWLMGKFMPSMRNLDAIVEITDYVIVLMPKELIQKGEDL
jgi:hypothetical protein